MHPVKKGNKYPHRALITRIFESEALKLDKANLPVTNAWYSNALPFHTFNKFVRCEALKIFSHKQIYHKV